MTDRRPLSPAEASQRLDKWLWFARITKSRTFAAGLVEAGKVRVNRERVVKASQSVRPGDVLTIALRGGPKIVRVVAPGVRRGPAPEARQLYDELTPKQPTAGPATGPAGVREPGTGRPTKRDRRQLDKLDDDMD